MITTRRNMLVGGHVTPEVKDALQQEARKDGISVSLKLFRILASALGIKVREED